MPPPARSRRLLPALVAGAVVVPAAVVLLALRPLAGGSDAGGIAPAPTATAAPSPEEAAPAPAGTPVPQPPATCSPAGLRITAGPVDAAVGHRAAVLTVTNCGTEPRDVTGYADVAVLDAAGTPMPVAVVHESTYTVIDPGPVPLLLQPGESAVTGISWSATVTDGEIGEGQAVRVAAVPGDTAQVLPMWVDLGTTGEIAVAAWATELAR
ncbi:DUF4232 domain-containing protein [Blastococcus sp. URHD0036]|uniref:DUF4232 domain-containing protein n=1 Tax=Blastococcus sp. URHD0036 TaxID=1380356 RepID=UPI0018CC1807|nr:DUF4232 domain-containing protein [Blastococcus sp. URHD0036]